MSDLTKARELANRRNRVIASKRKEISEMEPRRGCGVLAGVIENPTTDEATGRIGHWLTAPAGITEFQAERLLARMDLNPSRRLRDLTPRQVALVAYAVSNGFVLSFTKDRFGDDAA